MKVFESIKDFKNYRSSLVDFDSEKQKLSIGFVPTMGALHKGHESLVLRSRQENAITVVSVFVNPTQFNEANDFEKYPRDIARDGQLLTDLGVEVLLHPNAAEVYPNGFNYKVIESEVSKVLCGTSRPGHFDGVLSVVLKLLQIVSPTRCYFGEKDYQQMLLVQGLVEAFFLDTQVIGCPIVREPSGLAMSSRNQRLSEESRCVAEKVAREFLRANSCEELQEQIKGLPIELEYLVVKWQRMFLAYWVQGVRLIDNKKYLFEQPVRQQEIVYE